MMRLVVPVILMVISGGIALLYIDGEYKDIRTIRAEHAKVTEDIARADKVDGDLQRLREEFESFPSGATERLAVMLPERVDKVKLLVDLEGIANRHGLFLKSPEVVVSDSKANPGETVRTPKEQPVIMRFGVTAPYSVYRDFLRDLERSLSIRDLRTAGLAGGDTPRGTEPTYNFQFEVYTYYIK